MERNTACNTHYPDGPNIIRYCNEELDDLWRDGRREADPDLRAEIYHEAFRLLNREVPEVYLYIADSIVAFDSRLRGVKAHGSVSDHYWNIGEWHWAE
jgi:peptide/nickel transport system substrate-binding protein